MSSISELKMFVEYHSIQMLNRSFQPGLVLEVCEISYKFILASSRQTLSLLMSSISELKMFVEYHCIQMLYRSFHLGLVLFSEMCDISYTLNSLFISISELNVFIEYHSIHMFNKTGLRSVKFHINSFWHQLYKHFIKTFEY